MPALYALLAVASLVAVATIIGLVIRSQNGRIRHTNRVLSLPPEVTLGSRATLLQFSTEVCSPCRAVHSVLDKLASESDDVEHVDLDLTYRPDLASHFGILSTPTTFILDEHGTIRARIGGTAKREEVRAELERLFNSETVEAA
jgi:thiol-disulfide isomerase/thioredoxin